MFKQIMVPVDLAHTGELGKSLTVASDLSKQYGAPVCYVGVATSQPSEVAHNLDEYEQKLSAFAEQQAAKNGHTASARTFVGHDPVADLDDVLLRAVDEVGADLVVMASHVPSLVDYLWPSNGGKIAAHSKAAVFVVR
ncbi:MAG: universal stress protein [Pseudomonadota bacterium]